MNNDKVRKILISGGSGFVGQNIINLLKDRKNLEIYNLSNSPVADFDSVHNINCDALSFSFSRLNMEFDYIINLLALSNERYCGDFDLAEKINVGFTKKILDFSRRQLRLKKFIHVSSIIIYDSKNVPPVKEDDRLYINYTGYSFTKGIAEQYVNYYREKFNIPALIFRLANIYGPYQDSKNSPFLIPSKIVEALSDKKMTVFNLTPKRDWIYSEDAAEAIILGLNSKLEGVYNLASGKGVSVEDIIKEIATELDAPYFSLNKEMIGPSNFYCDISKIKKDLGWKPKTKLRDGIKKTIKYIKSAK